jgi:hypothetical protein
MDAARPRQGAGLRDDDRNCLGQAQCDPRRRVAGLETRSTAASASSPAPTTTWPIEAMQADLDVDIVLLQEALPWEHGMSRQGAGSLRPDARELHHLGPLFGFIRD